MKRYVLKLVNFLLSDEEVRLLFVSSIYRKFLIWREMGLDFFGVFFFSFKIIILSNFSIIREVIGYLINIVKCFFFV